MTDIIVSSITLAEIRKHIIETPKLRVSRLDLKATPNTPIIVANGQTLTVAPKGEE